MATGQVFRPGGATSGRITPASFPFYTTGEDSLRVTSYNAASGVHLKINGRLLDSTGNAKSTSWDQTPNTDRSAKVTDFSFSGTTLLNLTVFADQGTPQLGQTFVTVQLVRGTGGAALVLGTILQGYVTSTQAMGWPGSPLQTSTDSGGYYRVINGAFPGAGNEITETTPTGARWEIVGMRLNLATSATPGSRFPRLLFFEGGSFPQMSAYPGGIIASQNVVLIIGQGQPWQNWTDGVSTYEIAPMPLQAILHAGDFWRTNTNGLQATDIWGVPVYLIREWLDP